MTSRTLETTASEHLGSDRFMKANIGIGIESRENDILVLLHSHHINFQIISFFIFLVPGRGLLIRG